MRGPWPLAKANGLANGFALKKGLLITNAAMFLKQIARLPGNHEHD